MLKRLSWLLALLVLAACSSNDDTLRIESTPPPEIFDDILIIESDPLMEMSDDIASVQTLADEGLDDAFGALDDALDGLPSSSGATRIDRQIDSALDQAEDALARAEDAANSAQSLASEQSENVETLSRRGIDVATIQAGAQNLYRGFLRLETDPSDASHPQQFDFKLTLVDGLDLVGGATLKLSATMPDGTATLASEPTVTAGRLDGAYTFENVLLPATGLWEIVIEASAEPGSDTITFNILLE